MRGIEQFLARRAGRAGLAMGAALAAAATSPAQADQFGDFMKSVAPQIQSQMQAAKAKPATPAPTPAAPTSNGGLSANAGAMGLQSPTALPPLHKLGTDAVAVIEAATGTTAVRPMDYVFAKQSFSLGPKASVTMSYLSGCRTEVIQGGSVTVAPDGSKVTGGKLQTRQTPGCRAANPIILASASEAGATVNRITPFTGAKWDERALKAGPPVFKWDKALGPVTIRVKDMDQAGEPVVWEAPSSQDWVAYPAKNPKLAAGAPFKVEALSGDKVVAAALFSIDPALDEADNLANRVVPLTTP